MIVSPWAGGEGRYFGDVRHREQHPAIVRTHRQRTCDRSVIRDEGLNGQAALFPTVIADIISGDSIVKLIDQSVSLLGLKQLRLLKVRHKGDGRPRC